MKAIDPFLEPENASSYFGLRHRPKYANAFPSRTPWPGHLRWAYVAQSLKTVITWNRVWVYCPREQYCWWMRHWISLENKISTFILKLQGVIQTIVAHKTEELDNVRRSIEKVIRIARKKVKAFRDHITRPTVASWKLYAIPNHEKDEALMLYEKSLY